MSSKRAIRRRECQGKQRFVSEVAARAGIASLRRGKGVTDALHTYACSFCGGYHYGHPPAKVLQSIRDKGRR